MPLVPGAASRDYLLGPYLDMFEDASGAMGIDAVAAPANAGRFTPVTVTGQNYGFRHSALWFRVQVDFSRARDLDWVLLETHPIIDHVTFYLPDGRGGWHAIDLGDTRPFHQRVYDHREFVAPIPRNVTALPGPVTFYVREAGEGAINVGLRLSTSQALIERTNPESLFFGLCYGALLIVLLYHCFLWWATREPAHAYYVVFVAFTILLFVNLDGLGLQYLWPSYPIVDAWFPLMVCILMWAGLQFTRYFLDLRGTSVRLDRWVQAVSWVPIVVLLLVFTLLSRRDGYALATAMPAALILIMVGLGIWRMRQGFVPARYFVAGWASTLLGAVLTSAANFRLIDTQIHPIDYSRLGLVGQVTLLAMAVASRISRMKEDNERMQRDMLKSALQDPLTGLPNRLALQHELPEMRARARSRSESAGRRLVVAQVSVYNIKRIAGTFGHAVGDSLMLETAARLTRLAGDGARVFRTGEDEFVVAVEDEIDVSAVEAFGQMLVAGFGTPVSTGGMSILLSCNIGIAVAGHDAQDGMLLVRQAEIAGKTLPQLGDSACRIYTADMGHEASRQAMLGNDLVAAMRDKQFSVRYLPSVDGQTGHSAVIDAAVHWAHPLCGDVPEAELLRIAEDAGQAPWIEQWLLATACTDAERLRRAGQEDIRVSVTISPRQFQRIDFIELLRKVLGRTGLPGGCLQLNIGESALASGIEPARYRLEQCRRLGVHVSATDIGSGMSSLASLLRLHVSRVRITGDLIRNVISDGQDAAIVKGVIVVAHHLGLRVVAERVDTEEQAAFLRRCECDELQGNVIAAPMTFDRLEQYLLDERAVVRAPESANGRRGDTILLVDDEPNILKALTRVLRRDGYDILVAGNADEAFSLLAKHDVSLIISDQRMPGMLGTEFLAQVKDIYPQTTRIVLSGYADLTTVTEAINKGAIYRFLTKPWEDDKLREEVRNALQHHRRMPVA